MKPTLLVALLLALPAAACRSTPAPETVCTRIGCSDGVTVVVAGAPAAPFTVELSLPDGTERSLRCDAPDGCAGGLFFEGVAGESLTVRVVAAGGTTTETVRPAYERFQPNGPDCPPTCRHARVEVAYRA